MEAASLDDAAPQTIAMVPSSLVQDAAGWDAIIPGERRLGHEGWLAKS